MTNGELVSRIVNDVRALTKDEHISRRYILRIARNKATYLLSQKLRDKSLFREENLFRTIRCFRLKPDNIVKCDIVEFRRCSSLMKSTKKLPELLFSRYGSSIRAIYSIDGSKVFYPTNLSKFSRSSKRRFASSSEDNFYYIRDGYLYLPNSSTELVDLDLITLEEELIEELSECCGDDNLDSSCESIWDKEFIISDKLLEPVIQDTLNEVLSTYKQIIPDENPNMTEIQKDSTIQ